MLQPVLQLPSRHVSPQDRTPARVLAAVGVLGLLIVFVIMVVLIGGAGAGAPGAGSDEAEATATATLTPEPTPTPTPSPTATPLTPDQELERQDAVDVVRSRGFDVVRLGDYDPEARLRVLIGRTPDRAKLAFFFVDGEYLGNDSTESSAKLKVKQSSDVDVTLSYGIFQPGDEPDTPTGEPIVVTFRYEAGQVQPVEALPAPEQRTPGRQLG